MLLDSGDMSIAPWIPFAWGVLVGLIFSLVGAAGGILASVGLISVLGITDANQVKPMAQILTLISPLIAVPRYYKQCRLIPALALLLGAGGIVGALIGSSLSVNYLADLRVFKPAFAILILFIAVQMTWQLSRHTRLKGSRTKRASTAFEGLLLHGDEPCLKGVKQLHWSIRRVEFLFGDERFDYSPLLAFMVGLGIAIFASALGVGGGFLLVPFMSGVLGFPMFIVAGTAAMAIFISSTTSIANYLFLGVQLDVPLLLLMIGGTVLGSFVGPPLSKYFRESWLKGLLVAVLLLISGRYLGII